MKCQIYTCLLLFSLVATVTTAQTTYEVGPGKPFTKLGQVPWLNLQPGDQVLIHWSPTPYRERIAIRSSGTAAAPIRIRGVRQGGNGLWPVLDAKNATTPAVFKPFWQGGNKQYLDELGAFIIAKGPADPYGYKPKHIIIEDLQIMGSGPHNNYYDIDSVQKPYARGAAGIYLGVVENVTIRGCVINENGNGIFAMTKNGDEAGTSRNLLIEKNYVRDNGVVNDYNDHNIYTQAVNTTVQFNKFRKLRAGALGACFKDRSSNLIFRYNWVESSARALDFVESEDNFNILQHEGNYHDVFCYGNFIINDVETAGPHSTRMIHYGGDIGDPAIQKKGTLYFYHNTVFVNSSQAKEWRVRVFDLTSNEDTVVLHNNIFMRAGTSNFHLMSEAGIAQWMSTNVISNDMTNSCGDCADPFSGSVETNGTIIKATQAQIGFTNIAKYDFTLKAGSVVIDTADALPFFLQQNFPVDKENAFGVEGRDRVMFGSKFDVGAQEFKGSTTVPATLANTAPAVVKTASVYPNPATGSFTLPVEVKTTTVIHISLVDNLGRVVRTYSKFVQKGKQQLQFPTTNLAAGTYHCQVQVNDQTTVLSLLIK